MEITETSKTNLSHNYHVTVPAIDINSDVDAKLKEIGKTLKIDGFRPGKVPLNVLRNRYRSEILGEVLQNLADKAGQKIIADYNLEAATQPQMKLEKFEENDILEFSVTVDLKPEFEIKDLTEITAEKLSIKIDESEIQTNLQQLAEDVGETQPIAENRKSMIGDYVDIDFKGFVNDVAFAGGEAKNFSLKLGSQSMIPGFEDALIEREIGETFRFTITFPENYNAPNLAGQETEFEITLNSISQAVPVALDDSLAEKYGQKKLTDLKEALKQRLINRYQPTINRIVKRKIFDQIEKLYNFKLPENLIEREFQTIWKQLQQLKQAGQVEDEDIGRSDDELRSEYRNIAERRLRMAFFIDKFAKNNNIVATEQEIDRLIQIETSRNPENAEEIVNYYRKNPHLRQNLASPILEEKSIEILLEQITTTELEITPEELTEMDKQADTKEQKNLQKK